jgi:hypothetical protein
MKPAAPTVLALVVVLAVLASDLEVVHDHASTEPGLYNEECPLARLATGAGTVVLSDPPAAAGPLPARDTALPATGVAPPEVEAWSDAPRGPPRPS